MVPDVLVELADDELWVPQAGSTKVAMTAAAAAKNRGMGTRNLKRAVGQPEAAATLRRRRDP